LNEHRDVSLFRIDDMLLKKIRDLWVVF